MTKFARLGWIVVVLIAVIGLWQLKAKIDERALGIYTPEDKEKVVAYQQKVSKIFDDNYERFSKPIPEGATRIPGSEIELKEVTGKQGQKIDRFTTVDGSCKIGFRVSGRGSSWSNVVGAQINGKAISADRIANSFDVMTDCPKKQEELTLTLKGPKDLKFVYVLVGE